MRYCVIQHCEHLKKLNMSVEFTPNEGGMYIAHVPRHSHVSINNSEMAKRNRESHQWFIAHVLDSFKHFHRTA